MHKSIEPLYRCTKADKLQFTPLELTPLCCGQMRIIAFITHSADIRHTLKHIGATTKPPRITPARGPPLWAGADAQVGDGVDVAPNWDEAAQTVPDFEVDERVSWSSELES